MAATHYEFLAYHPYLSFSDPNSSLFVKISDGLPADPGNTDNDALFRIGRDAYKRLPHMVSKDDFDEAFAFFNGAIDALRVGLKERAQDGSLVTALSDGMKIDVDIENAPAPQVVMMAWSLCKKDIGTGLDFVMLFSYLALIHIDLVFVANAYRKQGAIEATIQAAYALSNVLAIESGSERLQEARQSLAYQGGIGRSLKKDAERQEVVAYWKEHIFSKQPKLSNDKAAERLQGKFPKISFRTLSKYVAQAKKEEKNIPSASKV